MDKQQNVVFIVGAGFSAPFGLPVMANFINKARDLYFSDTNRFAAVGETLVLIEKFSVVKNYMSINLHNIEDLLSIAYMESILNEDTSLLKSMTTFISMVIAAYTEPPHNLMQIFAKYVANVSLKKGSASAWGTTRDGVEQKYVQLVPQGKEAANTNFGIVTLNYDLLVEEALANLAEELGKFYPSARQVNQLSEYFQTRKDRISPGVAVAKLHGSVEGQIVPPIWNKSVSAEIQKDWALAEELLIDATHLIFLGYSLPTSDNYIKFLFASSLNQNKRLKGISVITKDADGKTAERYESIFSLKPVFHNTDVQSFFSFLGESHHEIDYDTFDNEFVEFIRQKKKKVKENEI